VKTDEHPTAFGVFSPTGHVVLALPKGTDLDAIETALAAASLGTDPVVRVSPAHMLAQADADLERASPLASVGQERNLVKAHRELALQGHTFLVIDAPDDEQVQRVAEIARRFGAARAQRYGRFVIEELIEVGSTDQQTPESPELGLDAQTTSGHEGDEAR
jgi:hypothetical protein